MSKTGTTMKDIAEECGVSLSTVSLVLSNNPRISDETRQRVKAAVERSGYQPDVHAKGLALRTSRTLSVVVPEINHVFADIYFGEIISGVYDRASDRKYKILLDVSNANYIERKEYFNVLNTRRADAMLFISASLYDRFLLDFEKEDRPFLLVNHYFPDSSLNYLAADYVDTARQAAGHLLQLGHRTIGLISGTNVQTAVDFRSEFEKQCAKAGLGTKDLPWADGDFREEGGFRAAQQLMKEHPSITALMAGNDKMAIGALRYVLSEGLSVPGDVSVMGVDDIPAASFTTPGLTTVRHQLYEMGRRACDCVLDLFDGKRTSCQEVLPVELMVRESTGPARIG